MEIGETAKNEVNLGDDINENVDATQFNFQDADQSESNRSREKVYYHMVSPAIYPKDYVRMNEGVCVK